LATFGFEQPLAAAQASLVHSSPSLQFCCSALPVQAPDWQVWRRHSRPLQ